MSYYGGEKSPGFSFAVPQLSSNSAASDHNTDQPGQVPSHPRTPKDYQSKAHHLVPTNLERSRTASTNTFKRHADLENSVDQVPSIYSTGSSHEDYSEATSSPTSDNEEEEELQVTKPAKRRRIHSEMHKLSERKRRDNINKKMRALQALVPFSDKVDKASMLDNAIEYLKSLQLQLQLMQLMTMGSRICVPQTPMMLPTIQQIQAANMMGMRMPFGVVGFCQFPNPGMLGLFPGRLPPMLPGSQPPFVPLMGGSPALPPMPCSSDLMPINNNHNFS